MKKILLLITFIMVLAASSMASAVECTADAKICPDGSAVGRDFNNNCEFKPCPSTATEIVVCSDSDSGADYYTAGSVKWYVSDYGEYWTQSDVCREIPEGDNKASGPYLIEMTCDGGTLTAVNYKCPNRCSNGACVESTTTTSTCTDSDGGKEYYKKGVVKAGILSSEDYCPDANWVIDFECREWDGVNYDIGFSGGYYKDPQKEYGQTINVLSLDEKEATFEINGQVKKIQVKGHSLFDESGIIVMLDNPVPPPAVTYYLSNKYYGREMYLCPNGCSNGACIKEGDAGKCSDSDGGADYYVKGVISGYMKDGSYSRTYDQCTGNRLQEWQCEDGYVKNLEPYDCPNGCYEGACIKEEYDMDSCLDSSPSNYWDQETNTCKSGFSKDLIRKSCSDPDGGKNSNVYAHTFGFRSYYADSRDQRIRTGGADACISANQLVEHYCDENGFIQTVYLDCLKGCKNGACITEQTACKESDGGMNYYEKGTVYLNGEELTDFCYNYGDPNQMNVNDKNYGSCDGKIPGCVLVEHSCNSDGTLRKEKYECAEGCRDGACIGGTELVKETVTCIFEDGKGEQECYSEKGSCKAYLGTKCKEGEKCLPAEPPVCKVEVSGKKGEKITWKSSCGGYAYTTIDGSDEYAKFDCSGQQTVICPMWALPLCPNGKLVPQGYDENGCQLPPKCVEDVVCTEQYDPVCGSDGNTYSNSCFADAAGVKWKKGACTGTKKCNGCLLEDGSCLDYGFRISRNDIGGAFYCDIGKTFKPQREEISACQNNFECLSNQCSNGKCIDLEKQLKETQSTLNKIMDWLRSFFGFKKPVMQGND